MHIHRIRRALVVSGVAGALLAGTLAGTTSAYTHPSGVTVTPLPSIVLKGSDAAYRVVVTNNSAVAFNHVVLAATTPRGASFGQAVPDQGTCAARAFLCDIGPVAPGGQAGVTVAYKTPSSGTSMTIRVGEAVTGRWIVDAQTVSATTTLTSDASLAGAFAFLSGGQQLSTGGTQQSTNVTAPSGSNIVVALQQTNTIAGTDWCAQLHLSCIGQWSNVNVGNGQTYGAPFPITLTIDHSLITPDNEDDGPPAYNEVNVIHALDSGGYEQLNGEEANEGGDICDSPTNPSNAPCLIEHDNGTTTTITIWTYTNGNYRGY